MSGFTARTHVERSAAGLLAVCMGFLLSVPLCAARSDPATGRVRLIYFGDPIGASPFPFMMNEPLLAPAAVMACKMWYPYETIRKSMRIYAPRTFEALDSSYDMIILSDANVLSFETRHLDWFSHFVADKGGGLAMIGGFESFGGQGYLSWGPTPVGDVLPVECVAGGYNAEGQIIIVQPDCPVVSNLPWNTLGPSNYLGGNRVTLKTGSELVARFSDSNPLFVWWKCGKGRSYAMAGDWTPAGGTQFMKWDYYGDYAVNVVLFTASEEVPADVEIMHSVRGILRAYGETKGYLYSLMDFAEKFGASMNGIERSIGEAELEASRARSLYMSYDFHGAASAAAEAVAMLEAALDDAVRAKDSAMLWVFLVEWLAVISTCMVSGLVLYELMIARRLLKPAPSSIFTKGMS